MLEFFKFLLGCFKSEAITCLKATQRGDNVLAMAHGTLDDESVCWLTQKQMPRFVRQSVSQAVTQSCSQSVSFVCLSVCRHSVISSFRIQTSLPYIAERLGLATVCMCVCVCDYVCVCLPVYWGLLCVAGH